MKKTSIVKVVELLMSLKARYADLLEDKNHMLSTYEFNCPQDEFEYDCVLEELDELEESMDKIYDIICNEHTIVVDDMIYYADDEFMPY